MALKKGADRAISSKVNRTSVVLPFMEWQSSHNLVFYFANENKKLTKKGKKEEKDNDVPPKKGKKKSHNKVRCPSQNFHFYICDTLKLPFFVSCWQVSDVRRKKKGMVNDVSVSNKSYESMI